MYLSYDPLRRLLAERNLKKADLAQAAGLSSRTVAKLFKNEKKDELNMNGIIGKTAKVIEEKIKDLTRRIKNNEI